MFSINEAQTQQHRISFETELEKFRVCDRDTALFQSGASGFSGLFRGDSSVNMDHFRCPRKIKHKYGIVRC